MVGEKVDGQILFGARSEKPNILFSAKGEKPKILFGAKWQLQNILFGSQMVKLFGRIFGLIGEDCIILWLFGITEFSFWLTFAIGYSDR